jgi:hypothetical protein
MPTKWMRLPVRVKPGAEAVCSEELVEFLSVMPGDMIVADIAWGIQRVRE